MKNLHIVSNADLLRVFLAGTALSMTIAVVLFTA